MENNQSKPDIHFDISSWRKESDGADRCAIICYITVNVGLNTDLTYTCRVSVFEQDQHKVLDQMKAIIVKKEEQGKTILTNLLGRLLKNES